MKAVFLDRDGVINQAVVRNGRPYPPDRIEDVAVLPGVAEGLSRLKAAGFALIVVTNQPDVATGKQRREVVEAIHDKLRAELPLDAVFSCMEVDSEACRCYKPKPGMLLDAADQFGIDLSASYMVGDRWRDVGAGRAVGCYTIFIDYGYDERRPDGPDAIVTDSAAAFGHILERANPGGH